jgi:signal transduction histidine kinase
MLAVPVISHGAVVGAVTLFYADSDRRYGPSDVGLAEELARRVAIAQENARLLAEARHAAHVRDEVLSIVAHDLRNPLATVATAAAVLTRIPDQPERSRRLLASVQSSVERAERLIGDLLDVGAIEAGRLSVRHEPLDVADVVLGACESFRTRAQEQGQTLTCDTEEDLPAVCGDADRLHQMLGNLLGNAIKFTQAGGHVRVRATRMGEAIHLTVADDGPGIPEADLPHLFERFWQATRTRKGGAGLGLAIVKGIVEAHGGSISAASQSGAGATFTITLPLRGVSC